MAASPTRMPTRASAPHARGGKRRSPRSGGRRIVSAAAGSRVSATAGSPSVRTLTKSTCTTVIGTPSPAKIATAKSATSPRFAESRKATNFRMLSAIARPSRIAATIVAKSSSVRTRSADSRAASVPPRPIATPTSARRRAGASLTPSPVTATTSRPSCRDSTRRSFSAGVTRAWIADSDNPRERPMASAVRG